MIRECIICSSEIEIFTQSEIVSCNNEHCQRTIENSIGLHYEVGNDSFVYYNSDLKEHIRQTQIRGGFCLNKNLK